MMKSSVSSFLKEIIIEAVMQEYRASELAAVVSPLAEKLNKYQPDKPKDGTVGFLAFNSGSKRMKIKTGRFLAKKLQLNNGVLPDEVIQKIAAQINEQLFSDLRVELCTGEEITINYYKAVGGSSCMTGDNYKKTKLYEVNPDRFHQLVMYLANDSARAIVSKLDNGQYLLDRIYSSNSYLNQLMENYAKKHNWYYRKYNSAGVSCLLLNGKEVTDYSIFVVSGLKYKDGEIPYTDTLAYYRIEGNTLTLLHPQAGYYEGRTNTEGYLEESCTCTVCGEDCREDETVTINDERVCEDCLEHDFVYCDECEEYVHYNDIQYVSSTEMHVCDACLSDYYTCCDNCGEYCRTVDSFTVSGGGKVCGVCIENYYLCSDCEEYHPSTNYVKGEDEYVCDDCIGSYAQCSECGEFYLELTERGGKKYCDECLDCAERIVEELV